MRVACVAGFEEHYYVLSCTYNRKYWMLHCWRWETLTTITSLLWTLHSIAVICTLMYTRKYRRVYTSPVLRSATSGSSWCRWRSLGPTLPCTFQRLLYIFAFYYLPLFTSRKPPFFASNSPSYSLPSDRMWRQVTVVKQEPIQSPPEYPDQ